MNYCLYIIVVIICRNVLFYVEFFVSCYFVSSLWLWYSLLWLDVVIEICLKMKLFCFLSFFCFFIFVYIVYGIEKVEEKLLEELNLLREFDVIEINEVKLEILIVLIDENILDDDRKYVLGLLCNYCLYCKVGYYLYLYFMYSLVWKCEVLVKVFGKLEVLIVIWFRLSEYVVFWG